MFSKSRAGRAGAQSSGAECRLQSQGFALLFYFARAENAHFPRLPFPKPCCESSAFSQIFSGTGVLLPAAPCLLLLPSAGRWWPVSVICSDTPLLPILPGKVKLGGVAASRVQNTSFAHLPRESGAGDCSGESVKQQCPEQLFVTFRTLRGCS